jgi:undecaprenyl diphosphate synthase
MGLLELFSKSISKESKKIQSNNIKLRFIGDTSIFKEALQLKSKRLRKKHLEIKD